MADNWRLLSLTDRGQSTRKCRIQQQSDRGTDKCSSLSKSFCGTTVLKALLKSIAVRRVEMLEDEMEGQRDCIVYRSVFTASKL